MKLKFLTLITILVVWLSVMSVHFYLYLSGLDIKTEYGEDNTRLLGTAAFILYKVPFYLIGLIIVLVIVFSLLPLIEKDKSN